MYRKIGYMRNYMVFSVGLIGISTYVYLKKNKRKNVLNTEIH
jgi:hypothetical protein